jgi:bifunctional DNA-binding transcriptional regulator/antitoxin component of YhaV-PrlF toxin-antitoxin module
MKPLGVVRNLDRLGRIVVPKEYTKIKGWKEGTPLEMLATDEGLLVRKYQPIYDKESVLTELVVNKQFATDPEIQEAYKKVIDHIRSGEKEAVFK